MKTNRFFSTLIIGAISVAVFSSVKAAEPDEPAVVIKKLYAARTDDSPIFNQTDDRAILDRFFRKDLADMIWKDAKDANGEMGALDFDPLYYSQDPQITDFDHGETGWGGDKKGGGENDAVVQTTFKDNGEERMISYQFERNSETKVWKIFDVRYPDDRRLAEIFSGEPEADAGEGEESVDYQPGGAKWAEVWQAFYDNPGSEADLMTPLVMAGPKMVPVILEAISHKDMRLRRYAIGALGNIDDARSLEPLAAIARDKSELDYFRGDALHAIYQLDQGLGSEMAGEFADEDDVQNLKDICEAISKKEPWLLAGLEAEALAGEPSDVQAYVIDKDPDGLNIRAEPRIGAVIGNLPNIARPDALLVHIVGEDPETGWVQIDLGETTLGETPWAGLGWVAGNMLAVHTKGKGGKDVPLYETADGKGKVVATIPANVEVTIAGSSGKALKVKYKAHTGWLMPESQCANPEGGCK